MTQRFPDGYFHAEQEVDGASLAGIQSKRSYKRLLCQFILSLPQNARLLDAGCGSGKTARIIKALRPDINIVAIDMSDVREHLPAGVDFTQGSVDELTNIYQAGSFDAVVCQHVFEHLLYPDALASGIYAVLKPGGRVFIETPNWTRMIVPFSHLFFWADYTHVRPFSRRTMHRLLDEYGFRIISNRTISSSNWSFSLPSTSRGPAGANSANPHHKRVAFRPGFFARAISRLVNPLLRDILIAVAERP